MRDETYYINVLTDFMDEMAGAERTSNANKRQELLYSLVEILKRYSLPECYTDNFLNSYMCVFSALSVLEYYLHTGGHYLTMLGIVSYFVESAYSYLVE